MKEMVAIGFGKQGTKIIHSLNLIHVKKIYVDSAYPDLEDEKRCFIRVPFEYELSSWNPEYPVKEWLTNPENALLIESLFKGKDVLVAANGIGGEMTIVCMEFIRYTQKHFPNMKIFLIGSLPFRSETDYIVNCIAQNMIQFMRNNGSFAYSIIENEKLIKYYQSFEEAYEASHLYIAHIAEQILKVLLPNDKDNELFWQSPLYYLELDIIEKSFIPEIKNPLLPYNFVRDTAVVEIELRQNLNGCNLHFLLDSYKQLEKQLGKIDVTYKESIQENADIGTDNCKAKVLALGKEDTNHYMKCREINIYCIL